MESGPIPVTARNRPRRSGSAAMKPSAAIASASAAAMRCASSALPADLPPPDLFRRDLRPIAIALSVANRAGPRGLQETPAGPFVQEPGGHGRPVHAGPARLQHGVARRHLPDLPVDLDSVRPARGWHAVH